MKVDNETRNSWELLIKLEYELGQAALLVLYCNGEQRYTIYSGLHIKKLMLDLLCIPMRQARYQITRIPYHRECFRLAWWFGNARERGSAQLRARITKSPDYQITVTPVSVSCTQVRLMDSWIHLLPGATHQPLRNSAYQERPSEHINGSEWEL